MRRIAIEPVPCGSGVVSYGGAMVRTPSAAVRRVVSSAAAEQRALGHPRIGTEHLLLGLLSDPGCESAELLTAAGVSLLAARHMVAEVVAPESGSNPPESPELTPRAQRALDRAGRFARRDRAADVTDLHLLSGVLDVEGLACQVLRRLGVDLPRLRRAASGEGARDADTVAAAAVEDAEEAVGGGVRPTCPSCRASLDDTLTVTTVETSDVDGRPTELRLVQCGECGRAIGVLP